MRRRVISWVEAQSKREEKDWRKEVLSSIGMYQMLTKETAGKGGVTKKKKHEAKGAGDEGTDSDGTDSN